MKTIQPKECVNRKCKNVFYVPKYQAHLPLKCQNCINKSNNKNLLLIEKI